MTRALTRDDTAAAPHPKARAADAMRTYDMLNAVPTVAPILPRRDPR